MIKIALEIRVKNHEEIIESHRGFFAKMFTKITGSLDERVEDEMCKIILGRIGPEVRTMLNKEGVIADVTAYIEKRSR
jgi:hypothetical protein